MLSLRSISAMVSSMHEGAPSGQTSPAYGTCLTGSGGSRPITGSSGFGLISWSRIDGGVVSSAAAGVVRPARTKVASNVVTKPLRRRMSFQRRHAHPVTWTPSAHADDQGLELLEHHLGKLDREEVGAVQLVVDRPGDPFVGRVHLLAAG